MFVQLTVARKNKCEKRVMDIQAHDVQARGLNIQISWLSGPPLAGRLVAER